MAGPLQQFEIKTLVPLHMGGLDISFTNSSLFMVLGVAAVSLFMAIAIRPRAVVPGRLQSAAEMFYEMASNMVDENAGEKARPFFPFVFCIFATVLMANLLGMAPYGFTSTSHIVVTFGLAIIVFVALLMIGFIKHGLKFFTLFVPSGLPPILVPLIFMIELLSFCFRPFSLGVRLFANMFAGHIALKIFAGFVASLIQLGGLLAVASVLPLLGTISFVAFELFVAFLQAYIFALLTSLYLHDAVYLH